MEPSRIEQEMRRTQGKRDFIKIMAKPKRSLYSAVSKQGRAKLRAKSERIEKMHAKSKKIGAPKKVKKVKNNDDHPLMKHTTTKGLKKLLLRYKDEHKINVSKLKKKELFNLALKLGLISEDKLPV